MPALLGVHKALTNLWGSCTTHASGWCSGVRVGCWRLGNFITAS